MTKNGNIVVIRAVERPNYRARNYSYYVVPTVA